MAILKLPSEIYLMILEATGAYDIENLALSCKQLYHTTTPLLAQHSNRRKKYRSFKFGPETVESVPELLIEIAAAPVIASYIVHADLGGRRLLCGEDLSAKFSQSALNALTALVHRSKHLMALSSDPQLATNWLTKIMQDDVGAFDEPVDFSIAFLLTLLINVESLLLPREWDHQTTLNPAEKDSPDDLHRSAPALVQLLVKRANDGELRNEPLQKLHTIYPSRDVDTQSGIGMECILPFIALDSLREVHHESGVLYRPRDNQTGETVDHFLEYPTLGKNIESIQLTDYVMNDGVAAIFFKDMHHLRTLEFQYSMKDEIGYAWNVGGFVQTLSDNLGDNLEKLVLSAGQLWPDTDLIGQSLRKFKVLTHLELSTLFFVNSTGSTGDVITPDWEAGGSSTEEDDDEDDEDEDNEGEEVAEDGNGEDENEQENNADDEGEEVVQDGNDEDENEEENDEDVESLRSESDGQYQYDDERWRLVTALPSSLQTLKICSPATKRDSKCLEIMFHGFEEDWEQRQPLLKDITVQVLIHDCWGHELVDYQQYVDRSRAFFSDKPFVKYVCGA